MSSSSRPDGDFGERRRVIAIGDAHGDMQITLKALQVAGVIQLHGRRWVWCGGDTWVVQMGDQLDRLPREDVEFTDEDSEIRIMKFFDYLDGQARKVGGRVLSLVGNHEWLQVNAHREPGNLAYVSPKGLAHFGGPEGRIAAFRPGGPMAVYMAKHRYAVIKIGQFLFVHGGALPRIVDKYTIPQINGLMRQYLLGKVPWDRSLYELFEANDSLLWSRAFSGPRPCNDKLDLVLARWGCKAMIVGHTPQPNGITHACNARVWRTDVAMSAAIGGPQNKESRVQVLEITLLPNRKVRMLPLSCKPDAVTVNVAAPLPTQAPKTSAPVTPARSKPAAVKQSPAKPGSTKPSRKASVPNKPKATKPTKRGS